VPGILTSTDKVLTVNRLLFFLVPAAPVTGVVRPDPPPEEGVGVPDAEAEDGRWGGLASVPLPLPVTTGAAAGAEEEVEEGRWL
jgi:hypothetical protein